MTAIHNGAATHSGAHMRVYVNPQFTLPDKGDGGIRRVVEAQNKYLPEFGVEVVDSVEAADVIACHAGLWVNTTKPVVSHCHGLYWSDYEWPKWALEMNHDVINALRSADVVTAPSEWVARILRRGMWLQPHVLYHGVEPDDWEPGTNEGYVLWNKTRVDPVCDPNPCIDLAARVPSEQFVTTYGPTDLSNLKVTGTLPFEKAKDYIRNAGVYLATSRETFGIGTIEAMACGVPILGWRWGGQAEFVHHKRTGWLATPGDIDGLAEGLRYCLEHREELGQAARETVLADFTWRKAVERYIPVYEAALNARPRGSDTPKVSVVIPAYNMASLLPDAVNSVLQQTYKSLEVVIVNDGSTDDTGAVADTLAAASPVGTVRVMHNRSNEYLAAALNTGISAAHGEYIVPLDADNILGPNALGLLAKALDDDRNIDIAYAKMSVIEPDGREWVSDWPQDFDYYLQMQHRNQIPSTSMYRKRIWQRVGGYRSRCQTAEDADFWCRATSFGARPKKVGDFIVLRYRNRDDSMSHTVEDWDWTAWYPWARNRALTPFGAAVPGKETPLIPTYEPVHTSVVIPVGPGHAKYLPDAVDSVVAQTFQKWEVIVVNDSGEPLGWVHPFARVLDTDGRIGPAGARNRGVAEATASTWVPLDADDYLQPSALGEMMQLYRETGRYVFTDWIVQETGEPKESPDYDCELVLKQMPQPVTALYSRAMFNDTGGFDEKMQAWEDWDFILALASKGYCGVRLPLPLLHYRLGSGGRREQMFERRGELEQEILQKWGAYIKGEKQLMACGGCGQRSTASVAAQTTTSSLLNAPAPALHSASEMVLVEYTGELGGTTTFRGPVTGQPYRFGPDSRVRYVLAQDAPKLIERGDFHGARAAVEQEPTLAAAGPPRRK